MFRFKRPQMPIRRKTMSKLLAEQNQNTSECSLPLIQVDHLSRVIKTRTQKTTILNDITLNHRKWKQTPGWWLMKSLRDHESVRPSGSTGMDRENGEGRSGVIGNARLTALAGSVLLVLIVVELVTVASLRVGLSVHVLIGVL